MHPSPFTPGLTLCRAFYREAVRPILDAWFPALAHSAALLGPGSEAAGFDTVRSTDHDWGPRVMLFLAADALPREAPRIHEALAQRLPPTFLGYPTSFSPPLEDGTRLLEALTGAPVAHRVVTSTPSAYFEAMLGFDPTGGLEDEDWLFVPSQRLHELTTGEVFHDGLGVLEPLRASLAWYPPDVWLYALAHQWQRLAEEEPFVGRCAEAGDELGSRLVAARLARDLVRLSFLLERRHAPYAKWLGSAFARLEGATLLSPLLAAACSAADGPARERALGAAYEVVAARHNDLRITPAVDPRVRPFYDRPYRVLRAERFAHAAFDAMDPQVRTKLTPVLGTIDQWGDGTWLLSRPAHWRRLRAAYRPVH